MKKFIFLIGAAKSGTTKLADMLNESQQICLSFPKEPNFFTARVFNSKTFEWYESLFSNKKVLYRMDASTSYTAGWNKSSREIAERIYNFSNDAEIIYLVRDPVKRSWSSYWHSVRTGAEKKSPKAALSNFDSHHIQASLYSKRISEYMEFFPLERIHFIYFEEFISDPEKVVNVLLEKLSLNPICFSKDDEAKKVNKSYVWGGAFGFLKLVPINYQKVINQSIKKYLPDSFHYYLKKIISKPVPRLSEPYISMISEQVSDDYNDFINRFGIYRIKP